MDRGGEFPPTFTKDYTVVVMDSTVTNDNLCSICLCDDKVDRFTYIDLTSPSWLLEIDSRSSTMDEKDAEILPSMLYATDRDTLYTSWFLILPCRHCHHMMCLLQYWYSLVSRSNGIPIFPCPLCRRVIELEQGLALLHMIANIEPHQFPNVPDVTTWIFQDEEDDDNNTYSFLMYGMIACMMYWMIMFLVVGYTGNPHTFFLAVTISFFFGLLVTVGMTLQIVIIICCCRFLFQWMNRHCFSRNRSRLATYYAVDDD